MATTTNVYYYYLLPCEWDIAGENGDPALVFASRRLGDVVVEGEGGRRDGRRTNGVSGGG